MNVPPAEAIETAIGQLPTLPKVIAENQEKELLEAVGSGDSLPKLTDLPSLAIGYALGIQTARVLLANSIVQGANQIL